MKGDFDAFLEEDHFVPLSFEFIETPMRILLSCFTICVVVFFTEVAVSRMAEALLCKILHLVDALL